MFKGRPLGRLVTPVEDYKAQPQIHRYMATDIISYPVPDATDYRKAMPNPGGMLGNDKYGCCTCSGVGHYWQAVCANLGIPCPVTEVQVLGWYKAVNPGWNPDDPSTDTGANMLDVLKYLVQQKVILAYGTVNFADAAHYARALAFYGGVYMGAGLPIGWQTTNTWGPDAGAPYSWGGHAFNSTTDDENDDSGVITWNEDVDLLSAGKDEYVDEAYVIIFQEWFAKQSGQTLQYLDMPALQAEMRALV